MPANLIVNITFTVTYTDGTGSSARESFYDPPDILDPVNHSRADFTVKSVGEVREGTFPFIQWRRIQAEYRICGSVSGSQCNTEAEERRQPGNIISYQEMSNKSP
jgi:hypothetical protein